MWDKIDIYVSKFIVQTFGDFYRILKTFTCFHFFNDKFDSQVIHRVVHLVNILDL
jgi:hypothetical protein